MAYHQEIPVALTLALPQARELFATEQIVLFIAEQIDDCNQSKPLGFLRCVESKTLFADWTFTLSSRTAPLSFGSSRLTPGSKFMVFDAQIEAVLGEHSGNLG